MTLFGCQLRAICGEKLLLRTVYLALMSRSEIEDTEKAIVRLAITPVGRMARIIPKLGVLEVIVLLVVVRAVVPCHPQAMCKAPIPAYLYIRPQMLCSQRGRVSSRYQTGPGRGAYRGRCKSSGVPNAFARKPVQIGCRRIFIAVTAQKIRTYILTSNP